MPRLLVFILSFCIFPIEVFSSEDVLVCAKFRENYRWSKGYELNATITKGDVLNRSYKTHDYNGYSSYALIFLGDDDPYIIELSSPYLLGDGSIGEDQNGRRWKITKTRICF